MIIIATLGSEANYATMFLRMTKANFDKQHSSTGVLSLTLFGAGGFGFLAQDVFRHYMCLYSVSSPQILISTGIVNSENESLGLTTLDLCTLFYWTSMQFYLVHSVGILSKGGAGHTTMITTRFRMVESQ